MKRMIFVPAVDEMIPDGGVFYRLPVSGKEVVDVICDEDFTTDDPGRHGHLGASRARLGRVLHQMADHAFEPIAMSEHARAAQLRGQIHPYGRRFDMFAAYRGPDGGDRDCRDLPLRPRQRLHLGRLPGPGGRAGHAVLDGAHGRLLG